ncbi:MAG: tRNA (N(6)-L-threonylcarbamoyladenosine(37)-C(2))-methylthiotransferase MtaB [Negativicutes bacterium]|nr:tRNA (N(6)-L-threonylcarbamoyladenosine(37)-C(2))-methylthiotransferase MtaB [Negativicutes bacterium]MBP9536885.1 tRNA (N(6)-L-threonylcarbamoyladenosine(37)-C(2))-methylthiotransferase MtaB [Negativicutes bacterium]MBP9949203.1 tRNA (N(6)-L-threonylcarbamoyladenosine(37)-C(2))-methylthiotransferase MtaB [Negativicutes bacterium]
MMKVAFTTLGCKVNQFETEVMEGLFKEKKYEIVNFEEVADVYVINTCSVTHLGEKKSRQLIRRAIKNNNKAIVAVVGCYSQVAADEIAKIEGVSLIVGTKERKNIVTLVETVLKEHQPLQVVEDVMDYHEFEDIPLLNNPDRTRAFLKIQDGCSNFCTYCIIPYTRGPLKSRKLDSILSEAEKLLESGFKEIVLTGIHLGAYGKDLADEIALVDVVKALLDNEKLTRLRLGSLESIELDQEILEIMNQDQRLCRQLHLPLQSGSDKILKKMNRNYTTAEFKALIDNIYAKVPGVAITTDVIVGFPGENSTDFNEAVEFIKNMNFSKIHIFPYSKRKNTPAANYAEQVSEEEKKKRSVYLKEISDMASAKYRNKMLNTTVEILVENITPDYAEGLASNYVKVYCENNNFQKDNFYKLKIIKLYKDGVWAEKI